MKRWGVEWYRYSRDFVHAKIPHCPDVELRVICYSSDSLARVRTVWIGQYNPEDEFREGFEYRVYDEDEHDGKEMGAKVLQALQIVIEDLKFNG